jgi:putative endonuclease
LKSEAKKWVYVGYSADLKERFKEHNAGKVKSTKAYRPLTLIYYESYLDETTARKREIEIKTNNQQKEILLKRLEIS